jgi:hypothetical protein
MPSTRRVVNRPENSLSTCTRSLIQLRLKLSKQAQHPSVKATHELFREAASLENDLVKLESELPALLVALNQVSGAVVDVGAVLLLK